MRDTMNAIASASPLAISLERARIDDSARVPVLVFFGTALFWLLVGTVLALAAVTVILGRAGKLRPTLA